MSQSRDLHRNDITNRESREEPAAASDDSPASRPQRSHPRVPPPEKLHASLASDDSRGHDSDDWQVVDDWPKFVPITVDEVEVIEAFLRDALDDILK